jgi:hypothetical protein
MRKLLAVTSAVVLFGTASMAQAVSFNINVGGPPIVISQPPDFIYPSELGFGVAVGVPYDMFYSSGIYYVYRGGGWYQTSSYGGTWRKVGSRQLPPELRRYNINKIHAFRDREYRTFSKDRDHYRGKRFTPAGDSREERHDMKAPAHEERRDQQQRRDERGGQHKEQGHER